MTRKPPLTLSTPCAACRHPYNWHVPGGQCQAGDEEKHCGCIAFAVPAPTEQRHTVDTITSDALDELYQRAERAEAELIEWKKLLQKSREKTAAHWAAIERVQEYAADLGRAGWTQAAIARRILAALNPTPETDHA